MNRRIKVIALFLVALTLNMGAASECESNGSNNGAGDSEVQTKRNPADRIPDAKKLRQVVITAYSEIHPYEVYVIVRDARTKQVENFDEIVARGSYENTIEYTSGNVLDIEVTIKPYKPGSKDGYCQIVDGTKKERINIDGGWKKICQLRTTR